MNTAKQKRFPAIVSVILAIVGLYVFMMLFFGFPIPRGSRVNNNYFTYYKNFRGIYYISVENSLALINHGNWGYLKDVDEATFTIIDEDWAKDATHVWFGDNLIPGVDVKTFHINASGVAVDKDNVYIHDYCSDNLSIKPAQSGIDTETAEYFIYRLGDRQDEWMRDKNYVYHYDKRIDVDRNSFEIIDEDWFIDKNYIYATTYNYKTKQWDLCRIDARQDPIEPGYHYFRNGRNIIFGNSVIVRNIDVERFEEVGLNKYLINNMLFLDGVPFLKGLLDVKTARFYFYGRIAADNKSVFCDQNRLDDIDAATFRQINDNTFEDKEFTYTIKENLWKENEYPFDKKKK